MTTADVVVAGAGHNSLITAAYLAQAGYDVVALDARAIPGGGAASEELLLPGYRIDSCSTGHTLIQTNPLLVDDELGLRVLLAHGGGALPALRGRLRHGWSAVGPARAKLREDPQESLRRLYYDTVVFDPDILRELVAFAGADHVLLGSDYPFDMADARPAETVAAAGLRPADEAAVLGGNAERLLATAGTPREEMIR